MQKEVLVRAVDGEPLKMKAINAANGLVYVANPASIERIRQGESWPVGFPPEDVFEFDEAAFEALSVRWLSQRILTLDEWRVFKLRQVSIH